MRRSVIIGLLTRSHESLRRDAEQDAALGEQVGLLRFEANRARRAGELIVSNWKDSGADDTLDAAYAESGDFDWAVDTQKNALEHKSPVRKTDPNGKAPEALSAEEAISGRRLMHDARRRAVVRLLVALQAGAVIAVRTVP